MTPLSPPANSMPGGSAGTTPTCRGRYLRNRPRNETPLNGSESVSAWRDRAMCRSWFQFPLWGPQNVVVVSRPSMPGAAGTRRAVPGRPGCRRCRRVQRTRTRRRAAEGRRRTARRRRPDATTSSVTLPRRDRDVACEGVDGGVDGVVRLVAGPHRVDLVRFDPRGRRARWSGTRRRRRCRQRRRPPRRRSHGALDRTSGLTPCDAARRRLTRRVGLAAVTAARLGTKPRSAAMPSSIVREAVGASSGVST